MAEVYIMEEFGSVKEREEGLVPYLTPLGAWALSVGTAMTAGVRKCSLTKSRYPFILYYRDQTKLGRKVSL
jgi:hypothetical protein